MEFEDGGMSVISCGHPWATRGVCCRDGAETSAGIPFMPVGGSLVPLHKDKFIAASAA